MLNLQDVCKRIGVTFEEGGWLYARRVLPEGIRVGGKIRFREQDIAKFVKYLRKRSKCRARGIDPNSTEGPAPPVYSTAGKPRFDPRLVMANEHEAERMKKSRTLASGSEPIAPQPKVTLPEPADKPNKVEG